MKIPILSIRSSKNEGLEVSSTIDRYQGGRDKEAIIVSMARSNTTAGKTGRVLEDKRRLLNVARHLLQ